MPKKAKSIDYRELLMLTVKEKYFNLVLGMIISLILSSIVYRYFLRNIPLNIAIRLPKFNTGKARVETKKEVKKVAVKTYVVQEGDDLWHIAEKMYGSGFNADDIASANKLTDASILTEGSKIIIPDVKKREATVGDISASATATSQVTNNDKKYVVQPGDSLSIISQKVYGDVFSWPRILQANNLTNADQIEVGMTLVIPR